MAVAALSFCTDFTFSFCMLVVIAQFAFSVGFRLQRFAGFPLVALSPLLFSSSSAAQEERLVVTTGDPAALPCLSLVQHCVAWPYLIGPVTVLFTSLLACLVRVCEI